MLLFWANSGAISVAQSLLMYTTGFCNGVSEFLNLMFTEPTLPPEGNVSIKAG
jgi:hypothetical protein